MVSAASLLSNITKYYVTFGGPDIARLRKTGEIMGLKLDGELVHDVAQIGVKIAAEMLERTRVQRKAARATVWPLRDSLIFPATEKRYREACMRFMRLFVCSWTPKPNNADAFQAFLCFWRLESKASL